MQQQQIKTIFLVITLIVSSIPYGHASYETNQGEEVLIYALPFDFDEYSMYTASKYQSKQWLGALYEGLVKRSSANNRGWVEGMARAMPTISSDNLTFTFTLRDNLTFSNGEPLTAEDVEFSLKVAITPAINVADYSTYFHYLDNTSITIISDLSFTISLKEKYFLPYEILSFPLIPEETYSDKYQSCLEGSSTACSWNSEDGSDAISAGAFKVNKIDHANQIITLEKNWLYYDALGVRNDKLIYQRIEDKNRAISSLADGSIHILDSHYFPNITELAPIDGITEAFVGTPITHEFILNHKHPWFGTGERVNTMNGINGNNYTAAKMLRKALSHVVDRNYFVTELLDGLAQSAATSMPSGALGWNPTITPYEYNVDAAKEIMGLLGFDFSQLGDPNLDGGYSSYFFTVSIIQPNLHPSWHNYVVNLTTQLQKIGIGVSQYISIGIDGMSHILNSPIDPPVYEDGGFDILLFQNEWGLDWNPRDHYDASGSCYTGSCLNFYNFDLEENISPIASEIDNYLGEMDFDARIQIGAQIQELLYEWQPTIPILFPIKHWAWSADVTGIDSLLISQSSQEWDQIYRTGFTCNDCGFTQETTDSEPNGNFAKWVIIFMLVIIGIFTLPSIFNSISSRIGRMKKPKPKSNLFNDGSSNKVKLLCLPCGSINPGGSNYCVGCGTNLLGWKATKIV